MNAEEKKIKVITGEGQETFVPESVAQDDSTLKRLLASFYGTDNFRIERKEENGESIVRVVKLAGAKGQVTSPIQVLTTCPGSENPVIILYRELADVDITGLDAEAVQVMNKRMEDVLESGKKQYHRMESARMRLMHSTSTPAFLPVQGF
jgi:hypothetical protein